MIKLLKEFLDETDMADGSRSGVYWDILFRQVLSSKLMGGVFKAGLSHSSVKGLLKQS